MMIGGENSNEHGSSGTSWISRFEFLPTQSRDISLPKDIVGGDDDVSCTKEIVAVAKCSHMSATDISKLQSQSHNLEVIHEQAAKRKTRARKYYHSTNLAASPSRKIFRPIPERRYTAVEGHDKQTELVRTGKRS